MGDRGWGIERRGEPLLPLGEGRGEGRSQHSAPSTQHSSAPHLPSPISHPLLIVNADDFGISEGVNRGVAEACERGILTSATLMVNMPAFEDALRVARDHPNLGLGVHLNLTSGAPVLPPQRVHGLVGPKGRFLPMGALLRGLTLGRVPLTQVEGELSAQIEKALAAGVAVTHLDSHHHVHVHPTLHGVVVRLAKRHGIKAIRSTVELRVGGLSSHIAASRLEGRMSSPESPRARYIKAATLSALGRLLGRRARRAGIAVPDHFRGLILGMAFSSEGLLPVLERLPNGVTELMCHPGYPDDGLRGQTSYAAGRESELAALLDPRARAVLERRGIALGGFGVL